MPLLVLANAVSVTTNKHFLVGDIAKLETPTRSELGDAENQKE